MSNMESSSATTPAQSEGSMQDISQQSGGTTAQSSAISQPPPHQGKEQLKVCSVFLVIACNLNGVLKNDEITLLDSDGLISN